MSYCTRSDSKDGKCTGNQFTCMNGPVCWDENEGQALDDLAWTHGGTRTDCQGGPCGCPEAAHE